MRRSSSTAPPSKKFPIFQLLPSENDGLAFRCNFGSLSLWFKFQIPSEQPIIFFNTNSTDFSAHNNDRITGVGNREFPLGRSPFQWHSVPLRCERAAIVVNGDARVRAFRSPSQRLLDLGAEDMRDRDNTLCGNGCEGGRRAARRCQTSGRRATSRQRGGARCCSSALKKRARQLNFGRFLRRIGKGGIESAKGTSDSIQAKM
jgi:hypothetical protein